MLKQCMFCNKPLGENQSIARFPVSKRVAFDNKRGRLWAICSSCQRWNLAPIEERWEALEDLERMTRDNGRLLSQTENIALIRTEDIDVVQVGRAPLTEEAWWRYGRELLRRQRQNTIVTLAGGAAQLGLFFAVGFAGVWGTKRLNRGVRWARFGSHAWRGRKHCVLCGSPLTELTYRRAQYLVLTPMDEEYTVELRCSVCGFDGRDAGYIFRGAEAHRLMRRVLAYYNYAGAGEPLIKDATARIERAGSAREFVRSMAKRRYYVEMGKKEHELALALEIAVNDDAERELLEMELKELEERWREEEELAGIVDGELTHIPALERLRLKLR